MLKKRNHTKKLHFNLVLFLILLISCRDNAVKPVFDKSINERASLLTYKYRKILTSAQHGWMGYYTPNNDLTFSKQTTYLLTLLKFNVDGTMIMRMEDRRINGKMVENKTSYEVSKNLKMELAFTTHGYMQTIFEVNKNNNDGEFVFYISSISESEIILESKPDYENGTKHSTKFMLKKAEKKAWDDNYLKNAYDKMFNDDFQSAIFNLYVNDKVVANFYYHDKMVTISYIKDGKYKRVIKKVIIYPNNAFSFLDEIDTDIGTFYLFEYDTKTKAYVDKKNNAKIVSDKHPAFPLTSKEDLKSVFFNTNPFLRGIYFDDESSSNQKSIQNFIKSFKRINDKGIRISGIAILRVEGSFGLSISYRDFNKKDKSEKYLLYILKEFDINYNTSTIKIKIDYEKIDDKNPEISNVINEYVKNTFGRHELYYFRLGHGYSKSLSGSNYMNRLCSIISVGNPRDYLELFN